MARVPPVAHTGVRDLCLDVIMLNLEPPVGGPAYVARLWLRVAGGEQSSNPPIVIHALFAPSVLAALPLDSVIVLIKRLARGALGARLHLRCSF